METPPLSIGTKKKLAGSLTKSYLTPCRRPGLSRPSSGKLSLNKSCTSVCTPNTDVQRAIVVNKFESSEPCSPVDITPIPNCDERLKVPLQLSDAQNKHSVIPKVRRRLTVVSKTPVKVVETSVGSVYVGDNSRTCKKIKLSPECINSDSEGGEFSNMKNSSSLIHDRDSNVIPLASNDKDNLGEEVTPKVIETLMKSIQEKKKKLEQLKVQETYAKKHNLEELRRLTEKWKKAGQEALEYSVNLAKHAGYPVTIKELMTQHSFPQQLMGYNSEDDEFE